MRRLDGVYTLGIVLVSRPARRIGLFGVVLSIILGLAASSFQPDTIFGETGSASANRLWSSGAELNSTTADMEFTSSSGTVSISSSTKRSGDYAYRANPTSSTGLFYKTWANSAQSNKFWFRTYLRIADDPGASTQILQIGNGASGKISVRLSTTSTLQLRNEEDNANIGSESSALSANTWYRIEVYVDTTTVSSTDTELRLDGASIASSTAENLAAGIDRLTWGSTATTTTDLYFDDIAINDSTARSENNWPGEGRIVHMQPNADGDNVAWTGYPSDTNDYDDVDEVTPNGDTDTNYTTTGAAVDDYNLESASSAGIGANDFIKLASVGVRIRHCGLAPGGPTCTVGEGGVDFFHRTRIKATSGGTVEETADIGIDEAQGSYFTNDDDASKLNKLTTYDLPGASTAPWTVAELDTAQVGVKNTSAQGHNITTIWLQVEYVDRSGGRMVSSGFELNSATAGMELSAVTNTPAINSSTFRSGAYSLQTANGGAQEYARFYFESTNTNNDYYLRAYVYIATAFDNSTATILSLLDTSNLRRAYIKMTTARTLELWDEDGQIGSASSALSTSTWYRLELRMNTSPSAGSHVVDGRVDGTSFASASNRSIGTGVARIGIGINASDSVESSANTTGDLLWDDVALNKGIGTSQNSWPGAGAIIHLRPNADDATNTAWTNGFGNVDEVTPNDATDLVSETTSGDIDDYDLDASPIGGSDVVNLVSVGVRFRSNTATQEDFRVRIKDSASGIAIESNTLSPASTTWTTNATADPKLHPLTAYTRPERSTAWTDAELDTAQVGLRDVLSGTGTAEVTAVWLLVDYSPPATITISGTCDQFDQTTDCTDDGGNSIAVAVGGTIQGQSDATVDGAWSISGVTQPSTGAIITVFINGETTDSEEAVAVAKYDGTTDITGVVLYHRHLTVGSADNQTISNSELSSYDNSVSSDEDIFFDISAGNDLTVDSLASYTDEELYIVGSNTYRPASAGGGDVTTVHVENDGTFTADSNAITVNGNWQNDGSFGAGTSGVTMNSTTTGRTLSGTMTGGSAFYDLTFNGSGGAWSFSAAAETDRDFIITAGTVTAPSGNLTVARNFTNNGAFTHNSGTVVLDTTTTATVTSASAGTTFNNFTSTTAAKTIQFTKHTTGTPVFTFAGTFTITGTAGNLINIYSDTNGTQWKANFNAHQYTVTYANIRDGGCNTGTANVYLGTDSTSVSNNDTCWVFPINRLWSGGAELQSATAEVETNFNDGASLSISTTTKRSGEAAWRVNTTSTNSAFNKYYVNTPTQGKYWARFYIYVASAPNTEIGIFNFNGVSTRISVRMNTDRSIELWNEEDNLQIGSASSALAASTWYRVELYHDTTTLSSTSAELRLNGTTVASGTANLAGASDRIQWGVLETAGTADFYFDDIAVNGPSSAPDNWPGEGKIVHMQPDADGDNVAWTDSSGNSVDFDEVDEITPDNGTTYISSSAAGNLEDVNLESASSAGIGTNDTITAVSVGLRFRACNSGGACLITSGDNYKARLKAAASGTTDESASYNADNLGYNTNYNTASPTANIYPLTAVDKPGTTTAKWTPTDLNTAQIGMRHDSYEGGFRTSTMWLLVEYIPVTLVTGTCDQYDQTTDCTDDGANEIKVAVNGSLQSGSDATVDGSWSVGITQPATGDIVTVFINGETTDNEEAVAVTKYDGTGDITGVVLFYRHLTLGSADNQTLSNSDIDAYDNSVSSDEDIFFEVNGTDDLTVDTLASYTDEELYIVTGNTFRPASGGGADVTTVDVENDGTWTADSNSIFVAGSWQNDSVFTAGTSTADFTATGTGKTIAGTVSGTNGKFYNLIFSGSGGGWSNSAAMEVANDLTMTNGTLSGTNNVTVVGHVQGTSGTINLTGGTFKQGVSNASKNFGTTSGTTAWTFNDLTFANDSGICAGAGRTITTQTGGTGGITVTGVLRIGESGDGVGCTTTLNAGNRTWTLSGTGGDPFQILASPAGNLTQATSNFTYTGNNGAGNTTIQSETYYALTVNGSSETYVLEGTTNADSDFTLTAGTVDTTSANNYAMTVTGNWTMASGSTFVANASTLTVSGNWDQNNTSWNTAATGSGTSTVVLNGTTKTLSTNGTGAGDRHFYNLTINGSYTKVAGERINIYNNFIMNTSSSLAEIEFSPGGLHIWSGTATVTINGTLSKASGTGSMFIRTSMPTITTSVGIDVRVDYYMGAVGTHVIPALNYRGGLLFRSDENNTLRLGAGTFDIGYGDTNNFTMGTDTTGKSSTVDCATNAPTVNVAQDVIFSSALGSTTLNLGNCTWNVGRGWTNTDGATITVGTSTVNFTNDTADGDIASNGQSFYNLTINDTGDDITITDALTVTNDLTMTAGDLNGTQNVTVNGTVQGTAGTITMTGGTFNQRVSANENFGATSGSAAWSFSTLKFSTPTNLDTFWTITTQTGGTGGITVSSVMQVGDATDADSVVLTAGNRTWTLSGTGGNPLQVQVATAGLDAITPGTSTFTYTGNNGGGNTTVEQNPSGVGYYNLDINNASETFVLEGATAVGNDLTVTNGVLSTTGSNFSLTVTRDLTLANTAGVGLTANGSSITVSRHWNDGGAKFTRGTSTVNLNGAGDLNSGSGAFNNLSIGYSTFTTTLVTQFFDVYGSLTLNGGTVNNTFAGGWINVYRSTSGTSIVFASATTLSGARTLQMRSAAGSITMTWPAGNYGNWALIHRGDHNSVTWEQSGNVTTTGDVWGQSNDGITGSAFNTNGHSLTAARVGFGTNAPSRTGSFAVNFGASTVSVTGTSGVTYGCLTTNAGSHTFNLSSSSTTVSSDVKLVDGTCSVSVTPGTSTFTFTPPSSTTKTYTPNGQSLHHMVVNGGNSAATLQPASAVDANGDFTISAGTYDTVSGSNYALTVGGHFTNNGTFTARNALVTLDGTGEQNLSGTLTGSSAFYNLSVTNSSGTNASDCERTGFVPSIDFDSAATVTNNTTFTTPSSRVEFNSGSTYTLTNINWNGQASGTRLYFRNSAASGSWNLNVSGTQTAVSYVNVSRSNASGGNTIQAADGTNVDCSNNVNWSFNNPGSPSSLAQKKTNDTNLVVGAWTNETSVKFTATITDGDGNNIQICVEKDLLGTSFSNTEDSCGSLVSSGSTATHTISGLTDASQYHWQARAKDSAGYYSSWVSFGGNAETVRDFGTDTTACAVSEKISDGLDFSSDIEYNDGSLEELTGSWDVFDCNVSGLLRYEVSFGTTVGGTDILNWSDNGTNADTTQAGLILRTNQRYYLNVRAVDNAGNTSSVGSSDGQLVLPMISMTLGSTTITFANLNDNNNRSDSKTLTLTTSTNAYGGYVIRQYATGLLTGGATTIPMFQAGTYASPAAWPGGFCTAGSNCGYGYTSSDTTIQGSNKFSSGTLYAAFATAAFGDIVADHTTNVTGATGPVTNQANTITHRVSVDALQNAKTYQTEVLYIVTGTF